MAESRCVGPADGCHIRRTRRRHPDDRQHFYPGASAGCDGKKGDRDHCLGRSRGGLTTKIHAQNAVPNIPAKSNRKWKPCFSKRLYRERNLVERFFSKLKHFRRIATRYDKLAENFLAMVQLASMRLWLRTYESTA